MTDEPTFDDTRTFGDLDETAPSIMDELMAELAEKVEAVTTRRIPISGRPGWWVDADVAFSIEAIWQLAKRSGRKGKKDEPDPLKMSFLLLAERVIAVGKGDMVVFESAQRGDRKVGPFLTGEIESALAGALKVRPGEKSWQAAIRWLFGATEDERVLLNMSTEIQRLATSDDEGEDADPFE